MGNEATNGDDAKELWRLAFEHMDTVAETEASMTAVAVRIAVVSSEMSEVSEEGRLDPDTGETVYDFKPVRRPIAVEQQEKKADVIHTLAHAHKVLAESLKIYIEVEEDPEEEPAAA